VTASDATGTEVECQVLERLGNRLRLLFPAKVPSVGFAVLEILPATANQSNDCGLEVTAKTLENWRYRLEVDDHGAIANLYDKQIGRELLQGPLDIVLLPDRSSRWPAWELLYKDLCSDPLPLDKSVEFRIVERGPVRVALEIVRSAGATQLRQRLSLATGEAGSRLEIAHDIDWQSSGTLLKAVFPIALEQAVATYDMGLGSVQRGPNRRAQYEVPAHEWADLSGPDWGVSILSRHKYGWDRPDESTLRLSLLRSPKALKRFAHQAVQDLGRHRVEYAVEAHPADSAALTTARAASYNQPLFPFQASPHSGDLGRHFSLLRIDGEGAHLMALKQAENSKRWLARLRESSGAPSSRVELTAPEPFLDSELVDGCERPKSPVDLVGSSLTIDLPGFAPRSFLLTPGKSVRQLPSLDQAPVELPFDTSSASFHGHGGSDFDGKGQSIPGELFPPRIDAGELTFVLGPNAPGDHNAVSCRGQALELPSGNFDRLSFLAVSTNPAGTAIELSDGSGIAVRVPYYSGFVGQWRRFSGRFAFLLRRWKPGFIERTPVAWVGSHRHDRKVRNQAYTHCYLFLFEVPISPDRRSLTLPVVPEVKLFSATVSRSGDWQLEPAALFYD
jgi:alpha-mannosidase